MRFGNWKDRLTYVFAEAQILVLGLVFSLGAALVIFRPSIPQLPPVTIGILAATMLFGPGLFGFFVWFVKKLRTRNMTEVHHVNARKDVLDKYYVEPSIWAEKSIEGPNPYPVNGGSGWAVQEFEWMEDLEELRVKGVWLEEAQDTKLLTSKSHMEAIYEKLTESHITLHILRDSVSEFGADIQRRIINKSAEARERGKMMDKAAVKDVFEEFEENASGMGDDDLPTLEPDDLPGDLDGEPDESDTDPLADPIGDMGMGDGQQATATDGGESQ